MNERSSGVFGSPGGPDAGALPKEELVKVNMQLKQALEGARQELSDAYSMVGVVGLYIIHLYTLCIFSQSHIPTPLSHTPHICAPPSHTPHNTPQHPTTPPTLSTQIMELEKTADTNIALSSRVEYAEGQLTTLEQRFSTMTPRPTYADVHLRAHLPEDACCIVQAAAQQCHAAPAVVVAHVLVGKHPDGVLVLGDVAPGMMGALGGVGGWSPGGDAVHNTPGGVDSVQAGVGGGSANNDNNNTNRNNNNDNNNTTITNPTPIKTSDDAVHTRVSGSQQHHTVHDSQQHHTVHHTSGAAGVDRGGIDRASLSAAIEAQEWQLVGSWVTQGNVGAEEVMEWVRGQQQVCVGCGCVGVEGGCVYKPTITKQCGNVGSGKHTHGYMAYVPHIASTNVT